MKKLEKNKLEQYINDLYSNIDGFELSKLAQNKLDYYYLAHEYGEATLESYYEMLQKAQPERGDIFYDLGSGVGKKVITSALSFPFKKSVGIEILEDLYKKSVEVINSNLLGQIRTDKTLEIGEIQLINGDFFNENFSSADIIYVSLAPSILRMYLEGRLLKKMLNLKRGARVITTQVPISSSFFVCREVINYQYFDGQGVAYIHEKFNN